MPDQPIQSAASTGLIGDETPNSNLGSSVMSNSQTAASGIDSAEVVSEPVLAARALHAQIFEMLGIDMARTISATLAMEAEKAPVITVKRFVSTAGRKPVTMQLQVEQFEVSRRIVIAGCDVQADAVLLTSANRFEVVKTSEATEVITLEGVEIVVGSPIGTPGR